MTKAPETEKETQRIEAFSDGVFAIVVTLLIFNVKLPDPAAVTANGLLAELAKSWTIYLAFAASFFFVLVMWINHHRLFTIIRRSDNNLMLLNGLLLFGVTVVPFPTSIVAAYLLDPQQQAAVFIYNGWFFLVAIMFQLLWRYAAHNNRLFSHAVDPAITRHIARSYNIGLVLYLAAVLIDIISPPVSLAISIGLAVFFAIPNRQVQQLMTTSDTTT